MGKTLLEMEYAGKKTEDPAKPFSKQDQAALRFCFMSITDLLENQDRWIIGYLALIQAMVQHYQLTTKSDDSFCEAIQQICNDLIYFTDCATLLSEKPKETKQ